MAQLLPGVCLSGSTQKGVVHQSAGVRSDDKFFKLSQGDVNRSTLLASRQALHQLINALDSEIGGKESISSGELQQIT
jgi:hypothetical protein